MVEHRRHSPRNGCPKALALLAGLLLIVVLVAAPDRPAQAQPDRYGEARARMVRIIEAHAMTLPQAVAPAGISAPVLEVMSSTPRHRFVPKRLEREAYSDRPLPIGFGQTISQPFIVALMTELLQAGPDSTVLEIGTGSGYQAAIVAPLVKTVCTVEIIPGLGKRAAQLLDELGYDNIQTKVGDGYFGWQECGPFDGILVTAAAGHVPPPLVEQLKPGGRMVIPVGTVFGPQFLTLVEKTAEGRVTARQVLTVRFVPLTRGGSQ